MRLLIIILTSSLLFSGCASLQSFIDYNEDPVQVRDAKELSRLLKDPQENYEAIRSIAYIHNPDMKLLVSDILLYRDELLFFGPVADTYLSGNPVAMFDMAEDLIVSFMPEKDPRFMRLVLGFNKQKLSISQKLSEKLRLLDSVVDELSGELLSEDVDQFFDGRDFDVKDELSEKRQERIKKLDEKKDALEFDVYEICGLSKGVNSDR